jgi:hypothetical protein
VLIWLGISNVEAASLWPRYGGKSLCWEFIGDEGPLGIMKLRVLYIGGVEYLLSGKNTDYDGGSVKIIHGNAEKTSSNVFMTLNGSKKDETGIETWIANVILDRSTLNGTYDYINHERHYDEQPIEFGEIFIDSDTESGHYEMIFIPCPK